MDNSVREQINQRSMETMSDLGAATEEAVQPKVQTVAKSHLDEVSKHIDGSDTSLPEGFINSSAGEIVNIANIRTELEGVTYQIGELQDKLNRDLTISENERIQLEREIKSLQKEARAIRAAAGPIVDALQDSATKQAKEDVANELGERTLEFWGGVSKSALQSDQKKAAVATKPAPANVTPSRTLPPPVMHEPVSPVSPVSKDINSDSPVDKLPDVTTSGQAPTSSTDLPDSSSEGPNNEEVITAHEPIADINKVNIEGLDPIASDRLEAIKKDPQLSAFIEGKSRSELEEILNGDSDIFMDFRRQAGRASSQTSHETNLQPEAPRLDKNENLSKELESSIDAYKEGFRYLETEIAKLISTDFDSAEEKEAEGRIDSVLRSMLTFAEKVMKLENPNASTEEITNKIEYVTQKLSNHVAELINKMQEEADRKKEEKKASQQPATPLVPPAPNIDITTAEILDQPKLTFEVGTARYNDHAPNPSEDADLVNEDYNIFGVFDGMGGMPGHSSKASNTAADYVNYAISEINKDPSSSRYPKTVAEAQDVMKLLFLEARTAVHKYGEGGSTTARVAAVFEIDGKQVMAWANAGDSRMFVYHEGKIQEIGTDQSSGNRVHNGFTRSSADGQGDEYGAFTLKPGMKIMLCSDGITGDWDDEFLTPQEMQDAFNAGSAQQIADAFLKVSRKFDDKTAIVIDVKDISVASAPATGSNKLPLPVSGTATPMAPPIVKPTDAKPSLPTPTVVDVQPVVDAADEDKSVDPIEFAQTVDDENGIEVLNQALDLYNASTGADIVIKKGKKDTFYLTNGISTDITPVQAKLLVEIMKSVHDNNGDTGQALKMMSQIIEQQKEDKVSAVHNDDQLPSELRNAPALKPNTEQTGQDSSKARPRIANSARRVASSAVASASKVKPKIPVSLRVALGRDKTPPTTPNDPGFPVGVFDQDSDAKNN